eukprot:3073974-Alexandrium_andersonii.AAC.1
MGKGKANVAPAGAAAPRSLPFRERRLHEGPDDRDHRGFGDTAETGGEHQRTLTLRPWVASLLGNPHKQLQ